MIHLIDLIDGKIASEMTAAQLRELLPTRRNPLVTTDFVVSGEEGIPLETPSHILVGYSYQQWGLPTILSIDHHGKDARVQRRISSTDLALEYVRTWGTVDDTVITHTDYDSVVAAGILTGRVPMSHSDLLGPAAISADHTGEENVLADVLQAIQDRRDVEFSLTCLNILVSQGEAYLPDAASKALQLRREQRVQLQKVIRSGAFQRRSEGVYAAYLSIQVDGELLPSLLPEAQVIVIVSPAKVVGDNPIVKVRLGMAAPEGMSLLRFGLPGYGGRWNAGSTGRHGGTHDTEGFIDAVCKAAAS